MPPPGDEAQEIGRWPFLRVCEGCGTPFETTWAVQRFHSTACRRAFTRAQERARRLDVVMPKRRNERTHGELVAKLKSMAEDDLLRYCEEVVTGRRPSAAFDSTRTVPIPPWRGRSR